MTQHLSTINGIICYLWLEDDPSTSGESLALRTSSLSSSFSKFGHRSVAGRHANVTRDSDRGPFIGLWR